MLEKGDIEGGGGDGTFEEKVLQENLKMHGFLAGLGYSVKWEKRAKDDRSNL